MRRPTRHRLGCVRPLEDRVTPAIMSFTLVPASSPLTLGGTLGGQAFVEQSPGSLTTTHSGILMADVDFTTNTINFLDAVQGSNELLDAAVTGVYQPDPAGNPGTAPGDYGGAVPSFGLVFAVRDSTAQLGTTTGPLALSGSGSVRSFPSTQTLYLTGGSLDYNAGPLGFGVTDLAGTTGTNASTTNGTFTDLETGEAQLASPISVTLTDDLGGVPIEYLINGVMTGRAPFPIADLNGSGSGAGNAFNFPTGSSPALIAPNGLVNRIPSSTLDNMTITLTNRPDGNAESLAIGSLPVGINSSGYDPGTGVLYLSGTASLADYQQALRTITYGNSQASATLGTRTITVEVNDGFVSGFAQVAAVTVTGGAAAPTVTATTVNGAATQRSRVTTLDVAFSAPVTFAGAVANAFTLTQNGGGAVNFTATANLVGGVTVVTLNAFTGAETEFGSLSDGRYTLTALANQISAGGTPMAANYTFGDAQGLFRFYGDMNADRRVDISDFGFFSLAYLTPANYNSALDYNQDTRVDIADFGQFSVRYFTTLP